MKTKHKTLVKKGEDAVVSLRLPKELYQKIADLARKEDRTIGSVMRRLLTTGLHFDGNVMNQE
jgi:predicted DNA-binding protein